jgi:tRNA-specific 2-thiouridylase
MDGMSLRFERPVEHVSPGQAVVLYDGDEVIGGGVIRPTA